MSMISIPLEARTKLNLGCGKKHFLDHVNLDVVPAVNPDVVHDLDQYPYPFPASRFDEIAVYDVIEHIGDVPSFMREIWRIGRPGARVIITTPHFSSANSYTDPTHRRHLGYFSLDYFTAGHPLNFYGSDGFTVEHRAIIFAPTLVNKVVHRLANRWPKTYEQFWTWMFPGWFLQYQMLVSK
jgi:SAM-dependent methyltransferase